MANLDPKVARSGTSLQEHLLWQLDFLDASVARFDLLEEHEALRIAVCLRILLFDGGGQSILTQLGVRKPMQFVDTSVPEAPSSPMPWRLLVFWLPEGGRARLYAPAQGHGNDPTRRVSFNDWWNGTAFVLDNLRFTRGEVIRFVANQDGGAHVDSQISEAFAQLRTAGTAKAGGHLTRLLRHPYWELLRQMAYEVQLTMAEAMPGIAPKARERNAGPGVIVSGVWFSTPGEEVALADNWYVPPDEADPPQVG